MSRVRTIKTTRGKSAQVQTKATPSQQAARKKYLDATRTRVSPERMAEIRAEWQG